MLSYTDSAVTVSAAAAYVASRGKTGWPEAEADQLIALRRGQDYIAGMYNTLWNTEFDDASAPTQVQFAIVEAALRGAADPAALLPDYDPTTAIKRTKAKGGPVETEDEYFEAGADGSAPIYGAIANMLKPFLKSGNSGAVLMVV